MKKGREITDEIKGEEEILVKVKTHRINVVNYDHLPPRKFCSYILLRMYI